ncbi:MAG: hypothetical protein EBY11_09695 [Proteobacteria bacterium]|nr:hypothetical protein [Pseudomonadota bacterium]
MIPNESPPTSATGTSLRLGDPEGGSSRPVVLIPPTSRAGGLDLTERGRASRRGHRRSQVKTSAGKRMVYYGKRRHAW